MIAAETAERQVDLLKHKKQKNENESPPMARRHREVFGPGHGPEFMELPATHGLRNSGDHFAAARIVRHCEDWAVGRVGRYVLPPDGNTLLSDGRLRLIVPGLPTGGLPNDDFSEPVARAAAPGSIRRDS